MTGRKLNYQASSAIGPTAESVALEPPAEILQLAQVDPTTYEILSSRHQALWLLKRALTLNQGRH
jgi:hypothetical protein